MTLQSTEIATLARKLGRVVGAAGRSPRGRSSGSVRATLGQPHTCCPVVGDPAGFGLRRRLPQTPRVESSGRGLEFLAARSTAQPLRQPRPGRAGRRCRACRLCTLRRPAGRTGGAHGGSSGCGPGGAGGGHRAAARLGVRAAGGGGSGWPAARGLPTRPSRRPPLSSWELVVPVGFRNRVRRPIASPFWAAVTRSIAATLPRSRVDLVRRVLARQLLAGGK